MRLKTNLDQMIYQNMVNAIIHGDYKMGQIVSIDDIAAKYEVSRTPVSSAVKLLANDKILEIMPNGRARIPEVDEEQMQKICETRYLIEKYAVTEICDNADRIGPGIFSAIMKYAKGSRNILDEGDSMEFNKRDMQFHRMLVAQIHNEYIEDMFNQIQGRFITANYLLGQPTAEDFKDAAEGHIELAELLQKGAKDRCVKLIHDHIYYYSARTEDRKMMAV